MQGEMSLLQEHASELQHGIGGPQKEVAESQNDRLSGSAGRADPLQQNTSEDHVSEAEDTAAYWQPHIKKGQARLLRAENLYKRYGRRYVVNDVSLQLRQGEIVGMLGPNGAGKTTSFYMIVGLVRPQTGRIWLDKEDITRLPMYKRAQRGIGYLAQEPSIFRRLSVEENILAILEMCRLTRKERRMKLEMLLEEFRLTQVRKNLGIVVSGGERRRTEIARALATDPDFIMLDEPFAGVDPIAVEEIQTIVSSLKQKNIGVLITDHNVSETLSITDRAYLMFEGKLLKAGTAEELAADEQVRRLYLGQQFELKRKKM